MDDRISEGLTHSDYTVGWICALDVELAASMAMLDNELPSLPQPEGDTNTYILGRIGQHNVVLTCLPLGTTGTNAASNAATNMLRSFPNIRFGFMVGIGGGAPNVPSDDPCKDIRLGDVVVSCPSANSGGVLQYDFGKTMSEGKFIQTGVLNKTSIVLSNSVSTLRARHRIEESRIPRHMVRMLESNRKMQREFSHPGLDHDQIFRAEYEHPNGAPTCHSCDTGALVPRKPRENTNPVIHYGLIGSANQVMRHGATRDKLRDEKNIICFEMEAAGLMDVFPCLVIRGICDYADSHKNKRWQPYAAVTAAAYAKEVLLATPTSEIHTKSFFNREAIYDMLRTTLYESDWDQLLHLSPLRGYTHHEFFEISQNFNDPELHWALRNIDFRQWSLNKGSRVLCLTGHPSQDNIHRLSSYILGREKAAGYTVLRLVCSNMMVRPNTSEFLRRFLVELIHCTPEAQRTPIARGFFNKLLEDVIVGGSQDWKEARFNNHIFLKYISIIFETATTNEFLISLNTAFNFVTQQRLLVAINNLETVEPMKTPDGFALQLINHLKQHKPNIKMLLTSSERSEDTIKFKDFLHIEYDQERQECLKSLRFDNSRYEKISEEYEGSFEWIWTHNEYKSWSISNTSRLLYVQGKPGSGKSTFIKYFNRNLLLKEPSAQQAILARFFYSYRDGELQRSHYNLLLSVLYEILHQDEYFFYHQCQTEFRAHQRFELHFKWKYDSLKRVLKSLQDYQTNIRYYLIIDAVDESEEKDRREILGLLLELCSKMKHSVVKIFMASRPVAQLEARRDQFHNFIKLDDETRSDIYNYAQLQLYGLSSTDLLAQATAYILKNAQGVFLWVKLISEQLIAAYEEGYSEEEVFELLKRLPTELEDFYGLMLEKMRHNKSSLLHAAKLFRLILFARRPLTIDEILHALGISDNVDSNPKFIPSDASFEKRLPSSERVILSSGGNFLEIKKHDGHKVVQIMHQTVREFFLSPDGPVSNSVFWVSEVHAHAYIAITCTRYLSLCAVNTALEGQLPRLRCWDAAHYMEYCQYLNRRPLASYALGYVKSHIDIGKHDANIEYTTSGLIEHLTSGNAGAYFLEKWGGSGLHQDTGSRKYVQNATAMTFRREILRYSSIYGFALAAELVLLAETDMDYQDKYGRTPLSLAAGNGHEAIVKLLLDRGANTDIRDVDGQTCLLWATRNGHLEIVKRLSDRGASVEQEDNYNQTPLSWAAKVNRLAIVEFLIEKGASVNYKKNVGRTPVSWAAENGHLAIVKFLIEKGADIERQDPADRTPLLQAAERGHLAVVQHLVEKGADIEKADGSGGTPLLQAIKQGHLAVVELLAQKGANTEKEDYSGKSSLLLAVEHGHLAIVKFLVEKGASVEYSYRLWSTPLSCAAQYGHLGIVEFLVEKGANIQRLGHLFRTPLSWAAEYGHLTVVMFLAEKGADFERPDSSHKTPLSLAVEKGHFEVVKFLARKGADTKAKDRNGKTPVSKAVENSRLDIVKFLVEMC